MLWQNPKPADTDIIAPNVADDRKAVLEQVATITGNLKK
jgi:hypothetical protein